MITNGAWDDNEKQTTCPSTEMLGNLWNPLASFRANVQGFLQLHFHICWFYFLKMPNVYLIFPFFSELGSNIPTVWQTTFSGPRRLKSKLSGLSTWILETEYFTRCSFAFLLASRKFMAVTRNIYLEEACFMCLPPPSIKSNACNSSCDSPEPALLHTGDHRSTKRSGWGFILDRTLSRDGSRSKVYGVKKRRKKVSLSFCVSQKVSLIAPQASNSKQKNTPALSPLPVVTSVLVC